MTDLLGRPYRPAKRPESLLYQLRADKWVALRSPETNEIYEPLNRAKAAQLKKLRVGITRLVVYRRKLK